MALETKACSTMVDEGQVEWALLPPPQLVDEVKEAFAAAFADAGGQELLGIQV